MALLNLFISQASEPPVVHLREIIDDSDRDIEMITDNGRSPQTAQQWAAEHLVHARRITAFEVTGDGLWLLHDVQQHLDGAM